jgi:S-DNA-T family DNA segregation ATPase FtsK/SpoIIIE
MATRANQFKENREKEKPAKRKSRKKSPSTKKKRGNIFKDERFKQVMGFFLILASLYILLAGVSFLISWFSGKSDDFLTGISFGRIMNDKTIDVHNWTGRLGAALAHQIFKEWFGVASLFLIIFFFLYGLRLMLNTKLFNAGRFFRISIVGVLWLSVTLGLIFKDDPTWSILGGITGYMSVEWLNGIVGEIGTIFILAFVLFTFLVIVKIIPIGRKRKKKRAEPVMETGDHEKGGNRPMEDKYNTVDFAVDDDSTEAQERRSAGAQNGENGQLDESGGDKQEQDKKEGNNPGGNGSDFAQASEGNGIDFSVEETKEEKAVKKNVGSLDTEFDPTLDLPDYQYPGLELLEEYPSDATKVAREELEENKDRIVETLNHYQIKIEKIKATIGPTVTLYEIIPAPGVRISKIRNLDDDIALSLSAKGIRIIAPIPGKGTIGIEVPNKNPEIVSIKSLLASERFQNSKFELPFAIGKTISNESYIADLTKMPHILMAGATGQGKSVGLNDIIASLLYKKHPSQLKFVLVDPKKVELTLFSKIERHFLAKLPDSEEAIITETRTVVKTLNSLCIEMDHRYELLKDAQVRNIKEYNAKFIARKLNPNEGHKYLPYIVLVVDEFADLIMMAGKEIESPLTRLAQLSRATGIHLIIATQRPSVNIITGTIKANFPARIAYRVISKVDSRTILDATGADQLVGRGDMLLSTGNELIRLQCAFVDTPEIERLTSFIGAQRGYPEAFALPEYLDDQDTHEISYDPNERDELFEEAAQVIVQNQQGSTSLLQRKLKLGYNRAGRLIDQLEAAGIVGPFEGSKAREVLVANEMALEQFLKDLHHRENNNE